MPLLVMVALRSYCGSSGYLSALQEGAARIGLDGRPTGVVTAEEEKIAVAQLAENIASAKNRRLAAAPQTAKPALEATISAPAPAISGGPRRLSLSDLREAGRLGPAAMRPRVCLDRKRQSSPVPRSRPISRPAWLSGRT
jgi:sRNA-binding protein